MLSKALSKEMRLHRQLDYNGRRAGEAIAVEERGIAQQEAEEFMAELDITSFDPLPWDDRLMMSPSALDAFAPLDPSPGGIASEVVENY
ncbi:hypothetical protein LTR35_017979 [Friedmanniomyces endolithicus]|uniref:Uncharacterized protein n=1 Tax=Friedmanniomyces endolithicus TaxID=329885 RepID=A0AAN6F3M5_9PEZI|nr:hypothetical protein LTR35_017979 [Friedmanniomyces endolithicus]KAK0267180.1 hypothetical protein LTS00_017857 [Friedmanniomyces endolithicus]KAK0302072.1 hypothetical protein LTR82_018011 [Friedmanniomyces endolithicus]KAK0969845.1 hypothetical protein LTR54_018046 [Friedmanniomyces endolithicus]